MHAAKATMLKSTIHNTNVNSKNTIIYFGMWTIGHHPRLQHASLHMTYEGYCIKQNAQQHMAKKRHLRALTSNNKIEL